VHVAHGCLSRQLRAAAREGGEFRRERRRPPARASLLSWAGGGRPPYRGSLYFRPMSLTIRFLGTSASRPTIERNAPSIALTREGESFLMDCGEGTQRQMMRYGISFSLGDIFFTHMHADHFLGLTGLLRTMTLHGRTEPLHLWGPRGSERILSRAEKLGGDRTTFPVRITEVAPGERVRRAEYDFVPFAVDHRGASAIGWLLEEHDRLGRFNPERARELGIPEGPQWGRIHRGEPVTLEDGRIITPEELVGAPRPGRKVAYTGDTRPCEGTLQAAHGTDVLIHEATFAEEERARAVETGHSTAREAARVAAGAGARRLLLTHISARYSRDAAELEREARQIFAATRVARDGTEVEVPYRESAEL